MQSIRSSTCRSHGHAEFSISFDPGSLPVDNDVLWLVSWLEKSIANGERYTAGQTCQIGWIVVQVRNRDDDLLTLWEPDMKEMPVVWIESVNHTLRHLRLQKDVVESVLSADDLSFPSMRQSTVVCSRFGMTEGFMMDRSESEGTDSGWFFGCLDDDHDHNNVADLRRMSLYEAAVRYEPRIVPYLALPDGTCVNFGEDAPLVVRDGEPLDFKAGSFLATRYPNI